jgi:hypothetical protein
MLPGPAPNTSATFNEPGLQMLTTKAIVDNSRRLLESLPDLELDQRVWVKARRAHKLSPPYEGPYKFKMYSGSGKHALIEDNTGRSWPVAVERLAFSPARR